MKLIETAVRWRHGTFVLFCLLALCGILALFQLPLELRPGGDTPEITISTSYAGAGPTEVEDLITRPIEEALEEVTGVKEITSSSRPGRSRISLEFNWGTDIDARLVDVLSKLQRVSSLPPEAGDPSAEVVSGVSRPMMWIVLMPKQGYDSDPDHYRDLIQDAIVPKLRQVEGVGQILTPGGREREVEVIVDPKALADRNLTLSNVVNALRTNNRNIRGGPMIVGRREYRVRTVSRSEDVKELEGFVLRRDQSGTVYLGDVADVQIGRKLESTVLVANDQPTAGIGIERRIGSNVPEISKGVRAVLKEMEAQLEQQGEGVQFLINYDENGYINQSIALVQQNLIMGAILASLVLLLFLGSLRTVAVIALTIPTTIITVFIVLAWLGRSLNVISLAGLAFAVGMVVDNAIVVLENIFTHMQRGKNPIRAAIDGTQEVWSAMLASTLTTVAVFAPIVLVTGEAGQLFFDIGIALSTSVLFSLFAALTLVPMLSGLFLNQAEAQQILQGMGDVGTPPGLDPESLRPKALRPQQRSMAAKIQLAVAKTSAVFRVWQGKLEGFLLKTVRWSLGGKRIGRRLAVLLIPVVLLFVSIRLLPPMDYLPEGNRNLIMWLTEPFPGTSIPEFLRLSQPARKFLAQQPEIDRTLVLASSRWKAILVRLKPELATGRNLDAMVNRMRKVKSNFPGYRFVVARRIPIFRNPGKSYTVRLVGQDLDQLNQWGQDITKQLRQLEGVRNASSSFVTGAPELQIIPNRVRLAEVGLSEADLGRMVEAALGGIRASEFVDGKRELDVTVELQHTVVKTPEQLRQLVIYTPNGGKVQLADVAEVVDTTGPDTIERVDLQRSITLAVNVERSAPLGKLVQQTEQQILKPFRQTLPAGYRVELAGSADLLSETLVQLGSIFLLSLVITYLLLVALYRSFLYPIVIMATVPIGLTGALLSLVIVNRIPGVVVPLDMITGLGFVILTGVVVNNAILLVDRALQLQREGIDYDTSLYRAVCDRLRPIFMSAGTTVLGMLPLAVIPGKGAELYQGLGITLTGGLALSTLLTPTVVPALMGLLGDFRGQKLKPSDINKKEKSRQMVRVD
ncbi:MULTISPECIES: efflux RND transporter permease subunit [unclassified Moorena]|uniref:efflux RND transporter permease subunit n=1 Tax=unclassified Moorena TaxID=2683338 RepID=UPI0014001AD0|nr:MULTISPECIES: efflux RND transporter permease subunit [unclassified Moorena]NEO15596.1 efflux RND transporter permease subunit [Moorena sp. SIO3E8]NEQ01010.1 efflux RND transporter permease subunit [Moorena sp. SIO3F7]